MLQLEQCRRRSSLWILTRFLVILLLWIPLPAALALATIYGAYQQVVPQTPDILVPPPGSATIVQDLSGRQVGGLARGLAPWVSYGELSPLLVQSFLAAEDDNFFSHSGFDYRAVVRAALSNWRAGQVRQGGSTITQQLAKMFVGRERTYERKFMELLLSRRIEASYSKHEILEAYLNRIYLGAGALGVGAAGRVYFDHTPGELTLAESATLAGIASSPSSLEPYDHPERAEERRDYVLQRMTLLGFITEDRAEEARADPVILREQGEVPEIILPAAVDQIRREIEERYGGDAWQYGALSVTTGINIQHQRLAEQALIAGLSAVDHRQGYRGPLAEGVELEPAVFDRISEAFFDEEDTHFPGLVTGLTEEAIDVWFKGESHELPRTAWEWAFPFDEESDENGLTRESAEGLLEVGDVILVEIVDDAPSLTQESRLEGALASMDLETGYLVSMVGGYDYDRSQFNRVTQGCRQPGSVFKPVIFSRALDHGMTLATPLLDVPVNLYQGGVEYWRPRNADGDFQGHLLFRDALIRSRNLPTIRLYRQLGAQRVVERAQSLGFTTPFFDHDSLSLGTSCVHPIDVLTAYGVFANGGFRRRPVTITSVVDGRNQLMEDNGVFFDGASDTSAVVYRAFNRLREDESPVIRPSTAYLMTYALHDVIEMGTGYGATELDAPAAGKTGTTNAYDGWFVGYTERLNSVIWVGSDRNTRPLGHGEHGSEVALPIWLSYMERALDGLDQASLTEPRPQEIDLVKVDLQTGRRVEDTDPGAWLPFRVGTVPTVYGPSPEALDLMRLEEVELLF